MHIIVHSQRDTLEEENRMLRDRVASLERTVERLHRAFARNVVKGSVVAVEDIAREVVMVIPRGTLVEYYHALAAEKMPAQNHKLRLMTDIDDIWADIPRTDDEIDCERLVMVKDRCPAFFPRKAAVTQRALLAREWVVVALAVQFLDWTSIASLQGTCQHVRRHLQMTKPLRERLLRSPSLTCTSVLEVCPRTLWAMVSIGGECCPRPLKDLNVPPFVLNRIGQLMESMEHPLINSFTFEVADLQNPRLGGQLDVLDTVHKWYDATIIAVHSPTRVRVHYNNWGNRYDEDIDLTSHRAAQLGTRFVSTLPYFMTRHPSHVRQFFVVPLSSSLSAVPMSAWEPCIMHMLEDMGPIVSESVNVQSVARERAVNFLESSHIGLPAIATAMPDDPSTVAFAFEGKFVQNGVFMGWVLINAMGVGVCFIRHGVHRIFYN